jgi:hypothetical protein
MRSFCRLAVARGWKGRLRNEANVIQIASCPVRPLATPRKHMSTRAWRATKTYSSLVLDPLTTPNTLSRSTTSLNLTPSEALLALFSYGLADAIS